MTKINEELDEYADTVLRDFQRSHKLSTRGKALNALIKDYARKGQIFRK